jgi:hypothetical protein
LKNCRKGTPMQRWYTTLKLGCSQDTSGPSQSPKTTCDTCRLQLPQPHRRCQSHDHPQCLQGRWAPRASHATCQVHEARCATNTAREGKITQTLLVVLLVVPWVTLDTPDLAAGPTLYLSILL